MTEDNQYSPAFPDDLIIDAMIKEQEEQERDYEEFNQIIDEIYQERMHPSSSGNGDDEIEKAKERNQKEEQLNSNESTGYSVVVTEEPASDESSNGYSPSAVDDGHSQNISPDSPDTADSSNGASDSKDNLLAKPEYVISGKYLPRDNSIKFLSDYDDNPPSTLLSDRNSSHIVYIAFPVPSNKLAVDEYLTAPESREKLSMLLKKAKADYLAKQVPSYVNKKEGYKYPFVDATRLDHDTSLIADPKFLLSNYNLLPFKMDKGDDDENFVADEEISFTRNGHQYEVFLELDNRTETNATNLDKILNYLNYARNNPDKEILVSFAVTDGSLPSKKVASYTNPIIKLDNLLERFMYMNIKGPDGKKYFFATLLQHTPNLKITFSGVGEAQVDIAEFLIGSNYAQDALESLKRYVEYIPTHTDWNASYELSEEFKQLIENPALKDLDENDIKVSRANGFFKGIWKYVNGDHATSYTPYVATIYYSHKLKREKLVQHVILGSEHDLDTVIQLYAEAQAVNKQKDLTNPLIIFPKRERKITALRMPLLVDSFYWTKSWNPKLPVFMQPTYSALNDEQLNSELTWLKVQYADSIYKFFATGGLSKADVRNRVMYDTTTLPIKVKEDQGYEQTQLTQTAQSQSTQATQSRDARTFDGLHQLALEMSNRPNDFVDQVGINEIPISVYKALIERASGTHSFTLPLIKAPSYLDQDFYKLRTDEDLANDIFYPSSKSGEDHKPFNQEPKFVIKK